MGRSRSFRSAGISSGRKADLEREQRGRRGAGNDVPSILAHLGTARDVTERRRTQEELRQSRRWLEALFDNALEAMLLADNEARYVDANPAACALTGFSREELLRMTVWDVTPVTSLEVGRDLWRAFIGAGKQSGEYTLRRKDGSNVEVEYRAVAHIIPGLHLSVLADVTDRERAEEALRAREKRFRAMIENSLDAIALVDAEGTILYDSPAANRILGRAAGEMIGRRFFEDLHPEDVENATRLFRELHVGPGSSVRSEVRFRHKDGSYRWLEAVATNLLAEPSVGAIVANYRDVTERKRAEEELRQLSSRLIRLRDEERRRIARELHDSTGQSLAALAMRLSAIGHAGSRWRPATRKALAESQALAEQCSREIRTLSYLLHPPLLDEIGLVSALRWLVDGFSERSGIGAALDVGADLGRLPREAETTLFRVVQESLANVHRHSGSASAAIRLVRKGGEVVLEVEDHGRGMAPAGIQGTDGPVTPGVGIAGMRERVRELGGRLKVDSSAAGTVVRVVLPLAGSP